MTTKEAPIAIIVRGHRLLPADAFAEEEIAKLPEGVRYNCYFKLAKSSTDDEHGALLNLYMAGIGILYDYLPNTGPGTEFPTPTHVRREILRETGFCDRIPQRDGTERKIALSMARDRMEFEDLKFCFELSQLYVLRWTEHVTGTAFDPWAYWKDLHPMTSTITTKYRSR